MAATDQKYSLQILRGVAATSVVYLHASAAPLTGTFGVDLFFVISGFVMSMIVREGDATPLSFIASRIARIVPLYWAVTTLVLVVAWVAPSVMGTTVASLDHYVLSLLFIPHFREDGSLLPLLLPGWTLDYEMVFYLVIFIVISVRRAAFFPIVGALLVIFYVASGFAPPATVAREFFHKSLWFEFILGMVSFRLYEARFWKAVPDALSLAAIVLLFAGMVVAEGRMDRLWAAGVPSFLILLLALQLEPRIRSLHGALLRTLVHVGDASYATYLSHIFAIGVVNRVVLPRLGIAPGILTCVFAMVCALVAGSLIYQFVDKPMTGRSRRLARKLALRPT